MADYILRQDTLDNSNMVEIGSPEDIKDQFKQEVIEAIEIKKHIEISDHPENISRLLSVGFNEGLNKAIEIIKSK